MFRTNSNYFKTHDRYLFQGQAKDNEVKGERDSYDIGATIWDGKEQSLYPASNNNASQDGFELHMNTMGWSISDEHYATWKKNVGKEFKSPQQKASPQNYPKTSNRGAYNNKGKKCLKSTAVYGETIFWKQTCN